MDVGVRSVFYGLVLFAAACLTIWGLGLILSPFLLPIAWALCLVTVTGGLYRRMAARTGKPQLSALLMTIGVALGVLVPLVALGGAVVKEAISLSERAAADAEIDTPPTGDRWDDFFAQHEHLRAMRDRIDKQLETFQTDLRSLKDAALQKLGQPFTRGAVGVLAGIGSVAFGFLMMLVTLYFLFRDGPAVRALVIDLVPLSEAETDRLIDTLRSTAYAAVVGGLATALIQGTLGGVALWITGVQGFVLWGFVMSVLSLLPVGGSAFVWAPVSAYFFAVDQTWKGAFLLALGRPGHRDVRQPAPPLPHEEGGRAEHPHAPALLRHPRPASGSSGSAAWSSGRCSSPSWSASCGSTASTTDAGPASGPPPSPPRCCERPLGSGHGSRRATGGEGRRLELGTPREAPLRAILGVRRASRSRVPVVEADPVSELAGRSSARAATRAARARVPRRRRIPRVRCTRRRAFHRCQTHRHASLARSRVPRSGPVR